MKKDIKKNLTLHLVSDSTGETLKAVSAAAAAQFSEVEYQQKNLSNGKNYYSIRESI